jgi:predicted dinucleotide-binding enzyme
MKIAILGGTGKEGSGLGFRWAAAGHEVIIGSRTEEKGRRAAEELQAALPDAIIRGCDNVTAADEAEIVVLSVPYEAQQATLTDVRAVLQGKLIITVVAPLGQPKARVLRLPSGLSAAEEAQQQLGRGVTVVAAFQNISATHLRDLEHDARLRRAHLRREGGRQGRGGRPLPRRRHARHQRRRAGQRRRRRGVDGRPAGHQRPPQDQRRGHSHHRTAGRLN